MPFLTRVGSSIVRGFGHTFNRLTSLISSLTAADSDPYYNYVTMLLSGDGANAAQNNTFTDSSANNFSITRNGNTTQGSFSPYGSNWSNYFDGSSGYLRNTSTSISDFGTGNFTVEAWVYKTTSTAGFIYDGRSTSGNGPQITFYIDGNQKVLSVFNGGVIFTSTAAVPLNQWTHIVICRGGTGSNQGAIFINGIRSDLVTISGTYTNGDNVIGAGAYTPLGAAVFPGYISNFRIVKGTDVYGYTNTTITVPTTPLTAISGTSLLTCQSNRFQDNSSNAFALTVVGAPSVQRFSPFSPTAAYSASVIGGSAYFDGVGDYLSAANNAAFNLNGVSFTVECWVYWNSLAGEQNIVEQFTGPTGPGWTLYKFSPSSVSGTIDFYGGGSSINSGVTPVAGQWYHLAISRNNSTGTTSFYVNGTRTATATFGVASSSATALLVGVRNGGATWLNAYLGDLRIVRGSYVYDPTATTITVPTTPLTAIANTQLLTNFTNAGITDNAMINNLETVGNAQISTAQSKFGGSSIYIPANSSTVKTKPNDNKFAFGTGAWTVEGWFYVSSASPNGWLFVASQDPYTSDAASFGWGIGYNVGGTNSKFSLTINNSGSLLGPTSTNTFATATWYHVAGTYDGSTLRLFVNGNLEGSTSGSYNITPSGLNVFVGWATIGGVRISGYFDDLRITRGYARYTSNFTPPTQALPKLFDSSAPVIDSYYKYVTMLLKGNGTNAAQNNTFTDSSANNFTITRTGNATQGSFSPYGSNWSNYFASSSGYFNVVNVSTGVGTFTLECWIYPTTSGVLYPIASQGTTDNAGGWLWYVGTDNTISFYSNAVLAQTSATLSANIWTHLALVCNGSGGITIYINGTSRATGSVVGKSFNNTPFQINRGYGGITTGTSMYLSNLRLTNTQVYTSNFTPPTNPLTAISGTSLLTCQSNRFIDASTNNFTITINGSPSVQRFSPFSPSSAYSTSTIGGSYYSSGACGLTTTYSGSVGPTADFTVEGWFYLTANADNGNLAVCAAALGIIFTQNGQKLSSYFPSTGFIAWQSTALVQNTWHHIVVQRSSSTLSCYLNGTLLGTRASATGGWNWNDSGLYLLGQGSVREVGYTSNVRISNIARYSGSTISVPTSPVTSDANTTFLLNFTNGGIFDNAMLNDLQTVGNAQISTTQSKFGGSSMYFNSASAPSYAVTYNANAFAFGTGDLTIEGWIYPTQYTSDSEICTFRVGGNIFFVLINGGNLRIHTNGYSPSLSYSSFGAISLNTWTYIAITRVSGTWYGYINGVKSANSYSWPTSLLPTDIRVGEEATNRWIGYIDDLRITRGYARYTSNFTPPTQELPGS